MPFFKEVSHGYNIKERIFSQSSTINAKTQSYADCIPPCPHELCDDLRHQPLFSTRKSASFPARDRRRDRPVARRRTRRPAWYRPAGGRERHDERDDTPVRHVGLHAVRRGVRPASRAAHAWPVRRVHAHAAGERGDYPLRDPRRPDRRRNRRPVDRERGPRPELASADDHADLEVLMALQPISVHERPECGLATPRLVDHRMLARSRFYDTAAYQC